MTKDTPGLEKRVAIVTGGSRGIGEATSIRLAEAGADVVVVHNGSAANVGLANRIKGHGRRTLSLEGVDVSEGSDARRAVKRTLKKFGRVDILVNNAGVYPHSPPEKTSDSEWDRTIDVNLRGAFLMSREVGKEMIRKGTGGRIVNVASIDAFTPEADFAHYDASKAGLLGLTRSLALSWGRYGITVNAVAPGLVNTGDLWKVAKRRAQAFRKAAPLHEVLEPEDVADAILFLCSSASSKITGQTIVVDSGVSLSGYMSLAEK